MDIIIQAAAEKSASPSFSPSSPASPLTTKVIGHPTLSTWSVITLQALRRHLLKQWPRLPTFLRRSLPKQRALSSTVRTMRRATGTMPGRRRLRGA